MTYYSRRVRIGHRVYWVEGRLPEVAHYFDMGPLGEHCRWWVKLQVKHDRRRWHVWQAAPPPPLVDMQSLDLTWYDRALAWAFALWALVTMGRR